MTMMAFTRCLTRAAGLLAIAILTSGYAAKSVDTRPCRAAVEAELDRRGVDRRSIKSISLDINGTGPDTEYVQSFTAWVSFETCQGNLVFNLSQVCRLRDSYSTGDCRLPNPQDG